jgi:hypothetical protein
MNGANAYDLMVKRIRKQAQKWLTDTCTIERKNDAVNPAGQQIGGFVTLENVPCRILPQKNRGMGSGEVAEREANRSYFRLELLPDAVLENGDRVTIKGVVYEVLEINSPLTDEIFKSAQLAQIAN